MRDHNLDLSGPATIFVKKRLFTAGLIAALPIFACCAAVLTRCAVVLATCAAALTCCTAALAAPQSQAGPVKPAKQPDAKTAAKDYDGWIIDQKVHLYGDQQLVVSPIGIKTTNPRSTICVLLVPPYDTVTVYNKANRTVVQSPVKTFRAPMQKTLAIFNNMIMCEAQMEKAGTGKLYGINVVKYRSTKAFKDAQLHLRKVENVPSSNPTVIDSQITEDLNSPTGAAAGLCKFYGIPVTPGIPLAVDLKDTDQTPSNYLQSSRPYKTRVTAGDFALPAGFKRLKSIEEINQSNVTEDAIQIFGH